MIKYPFNQIGKSSCQIWDNSYLCLFSGAQGEYAGLRTICAYHEHQGAPQRKVG